jgi:hypothetical protein
MAGGDKLARKPIPGEGTRPGEQNPHRARLDRDRIEPDRTATRSGPQITVSL